MWKKHEKPKADVEHKVFELLKMLWEYRAANPTKIPEKKLKKGEEKKEFPELVPIMDIDEDDEEA